MSSAYFDQLLSTQKLMAILRGMPPRESLRLAEKAWDLGISVVEIPVQTPEAMASLTAVVAAGRERGLEVGAGTVTTPAQVRAVREAGAAFTVAPGLDLDIVRASEEQGMPHLPGVSSPTEIQAATAVGRTWVKAFPAKSLGAAWFEAMTGPFPNLRCVATGGIDGENLESFLSAGAHAAGIGSALSHTKQLERVRAFIATNS